MMRDSRATRQPERVLDLAHCTWEDARAVDRGRAVAVLPVGALEAHGPHLPLATDVVIAEAMARAGADRLAARGHPVVMLPALVYTAADFAAAFPGTVSVGAATVTALLVDVARSLTRQEFRLLAIANAHLDPAHLRSLSEAITAAERERLLKLVCPDLSAKPWGSRLTPEFKSGACHAGQFESSIVMASRPDLVRDAIRRSLAPNPRSLSQAIRAGQHTFAEAGGPQAYFGAPAAASAEEGRQTIDVLGGILEDAVLAALGEGA